jgi:magnesium-transporting ATPase (P-type)
MMTPDTIRTINSPAGHVLLPTAISLIVVSLIVLIRWGMSFEAWEYHPTGAQGFLKDEAVRLSVVFLPFVVIGIAVRYYFYILHPELSHSPYMYGGLLLIIVLRIILRRMPFVKAVAQHIDAARAKAKEVKMARKNKTQEG